MDSGFLNHLLLEEFVSNHLVTQDAHVAFGHSKLRTHDSTLCPNIFPPQRCGTQISTNVS